MNANEMRPTRQAVQRVVAELVAHVATLVSAELGHGLVFHSGLGRDRDKERIGAGSAEADVALRLYLAVRLFEAAEGETLLKVIAAVRVANFQVDILIRHVADPGCERHGL